MAYSFSHEVPDGYMHCFVTYDNQSHQRTFVDAKTGAYDPNCKGILSGILPTTPYIISDYHQILLNHENTNNRKFIVTYIWRIKQQVVDPRSYYTYPKEVKYDDSESGELMLHAEDYMSCMFAATLHKKIRNIQPDKLLELFGTEHYAFVDPDFKEFVDLARSHGLNVFELSFMILDIDDITEQRRNW